MCFCSFSSFTREEIRRILSFEADGLFKEASFLAKRRPDALVGKDKYNAWHQRLLACCEPQPAWLFDTDQLLSPAPGTFKVPETEGPKPVIKSSKPKPQDIKPKLKTASAPPPRVSSSLTGAARPWVERPRVEKRRPWSWKDCSLFPPRKRLACEAQWNEEQDEAPQWKRPEVIRQGEIKPPQQWQPPQRADNQPQQQAVNQQQQPASFLHLERLHGPEVSMMETASFFRPRELGAVPFSM